MAGWAGLGWLRSGYGGLSVGSPDREVCSVKGRTGSPTHRPGRRVLLRAWRLLQEGKGEI